MAKRPPLNAGSLAPHCPPSVAMSVLMILAGIMVGCVPLRDYLDYRDRRDDTAMVHIFFILQAIEVWLAELRERDQQACDQSATLCGSHA